MIGLEHSILLLRTANSAHFHWQLGEFNNVFYALAGPLDCTDGRVIASQTAVPGSTRNIPEVSTI